MRGDGVLMAPPLLIPVFYYFLAVDLSPYRSTPITTL